MCMLRARCEILYTARRDCARGGAGGGVDGRGTTRGDLRPPVRGYILSVLY